VKTVACGRRDTERFGNSVAWMDGVVRASPAGTSKWSPQSANSGRPVKFRSLIQPSAPTGSSYSMGPVCQREQFSPSRC
jgi:hypothetical protein